MKNKSTLLNILLALIIVVLVFQLSKQRGIQPEENDNTASSVALAIENAAKNDSLSQSMHQKKSVGVKGYIMPKPALVIGSYGKNGEPNIMTAAWAGIANSEPLSIAVSIRASRLTYENILANGSFTVNVPSSEFVAEMDYVGKFSGRDENKFQKLGLTPVKGEFVNAPYIQEFPIVIECELTDTLHLGSHVQFIGKIIDTKVDAYLLNDQNEVNIEKMKPIVYEDKYYYAFGERLAKPFDAYKSFVDGEEPAYNSEANEQEMMQTIFNRKSVRHYSSKKVSKEQLALLVRAGMAAPTAVNKQPWAFVAIQERSILDKLAEHLPYAKMLTQATGAIVVCGDLTKTLDGVAQEYWIQDCSAASQNILLAAESMGLGAVWTGVYPIADRVEVVRNVLGIPSDNIPLNVIIVGYPTGEDKPKDKWKEENLHWEKW